MIPVLTTKEMKILDEYTCIKKKIASLDLMEEAGKRLYEHFLEVTQIDKEQDQITVVSGLGNNGGDSLVVGQYLLEDLYSVNIVIVGNKDHLSQETKSVLKRLVNLKAKIFYLEDHKHLKIFESIVKQSDYLIDGLFGIGLNRTVQGIFYEAIEVMNKAHAFKFSIDIPSGINGNNGMVENIAFKADVTAIIQNYKIGNLLNDAKDYHGKIHVLDIGILQDKLTEKRYLLNPETIPHLPKRKHNTHKYDYGSNLTIGGNEGMTGAPLLSAFAALRTGSGLSTVAIRKPYLSLIHSTHSELMIKPYQTVEDMIHLLEKKHAVAFGPGLGRNDDVNLEILSHLLDTDIPLTIDADGLYYLKKLLSQKTNFKNVVITPHVGEMAQLLAKTSEEILNDPLTAVKTLTNTYHLTVVLKGPSTIIANQNEMYFSQYGNPGMATAGSGDCLTGMITSFMGQRYSLLDACKLAVSIHGQAGNLASEAYGEYSMIASDIIEQIPQVMKYD